MSRVPNPVNLPPVPSDPIAGTVRAPFPWLAWFRAVWQRANEPWKYNPSYAGTATMAAGTVTIASTVIKGTGHFVTFSAQSNSGTPGFLSLGTIVPSVSFTINSSSATDTRTVFWQIWESL